MDLTDAQWAVVEPLIPKPRRRKDGRGQPWREPREVLGGILWVLRTGAPWKDLPERYPPYQTCHRRFQHWCREGTLKRVLHALADDLYERGTIDLTECFIDATFAAAKKRGACVGKTKRGKGTKIMAIADRSGLPVAIGIASASPHEVTLVEKTIDSRFLAAAPERLIGDRAYDSDGLDERLRQERGIELIARHRPPLCDLSVRNSAKMWPVGWEALEQWGDDVARIEPLAGGVANDVWSVRVNGHLAVGRLGARSDADLAWETELLQHLDREGLTVPVPIPTTDGRLFADGLVVMTYVEGGPPETEADWRRVADTLRQLHRLTQGRPQRPGWRSSTDLLRAETGTKIDLGAMPPEGVARCRAAWARLTGRQTCVVHGDPNNPRNVRMTANRVALIDWDESHVDVPDLDLVLPHNAAGLDDGAHDIAAQASAAWEAAVCWDDDYAVKRLAEVRAV